MNEAPGMHKKCMTGVKERSQQNLKFECEEYMYTDSHCHLNMLDLSEVNGQLDQIILQACQQGVNHFLSVAVSLSDHRDLVEIAEKYANVAISAGIHPNEMPGEPIVLEKLFTQALHPRVVAIGETGLDYYRSQGDLSWQQRRFVQHIDCAKQLNKPLIIHTREAREDTIRILIEQNAGQVGGVMHCFTEDWVMAKQCLDLGFYLSFSGIVTFKNAHQIQEVARLCPLDKMLIETDSPYLAPVPHRGKPNVPGYVIHVAEYIAKLRDLPVQTIAEQTTKNFFTLFKVT